MPALSGPRAGDLTVVVPTHGRGAILQRTLAALREQTVRGFEVLVVVDGTDQPVPPASNGVTVLVKEHGGPGAARNHGARATDRPLLLFLGDDMVPVPGLVAAHLARHAREPEPEVAVLGLVRWHPEVARNRLARWLDWSASQFDFAGMTGDAASWGQFYSCNVSLKRELFLAAGGFDEDFTFDYEDLDIGFRLGRRGLRLRFEPAAVVHHLHAYDWPALERRYRSRAEAERMMAAKHDWFEPFFAGRVLQAQRQPAVSGVWPRLADLVPARPARLRREVRQRANTWYHQRLADPFLDVWEGQRGLDELKAYLGDRYEQRRLHEHMHEVEREEHAAPDEATFYRTSEAYLYDLTVFAMTGTKTPYLRDLRRHVPPGSRVLDYGCGIGSDGLRLLDLGYEVGFADFDNPSTRFLRWRLEQRGHRAEVYDLDRHVPGGFDAAYSFDVIEHVDDPFAFLAELESRARVVAVNFLEPVPHDTHVHKPLPIPALLDHAARRGLVRYRRYHGRSHLVVYRSGAVRGVARARSLAQRWAGDPRTRRLLAGGTA